jgi:hypothetical protein|tara:strand:+ start:240 stop:491 length:252 start_codon:yes stop_codon:yes gene_type:complete
MGLRSRVERLEEKQHRLALEKLQAMSDEELLGVMASTDPKLERLPGETVEKWFERTGKLLGIEKPKPQSIEVDFSAPEKENSY